MTKPVIISGKDWLPGLPEGTVVTSPTAKPATAITKSGTSLSSVVMSWTAPAERTPATLTPVNSQIAAIEATAPANGLAASDGMNTFR